LYEVCQGTAPFAGLRRARFYSQDHDVASHDWVSRHLFRHPSARFTNAEFLEQLAILGLDVIGVDDQPAQLLVVATKRH